MMSSVIEAVSTNISFWKTIPVGSAVPVALALIQRDI